VRAFVTGATGFIGGALARALVAAGWDVTALVRRESAKVPGCAPALGDITQPETLRAMEGHDAVFHLAAWYALGVRDRATMERVNVDGTANVLEAARAAGIPRIVYCSTVAALGRAPGGVSDETRAHSGVYASIYEETKHRAYEIVAASDLPVVTVMPGATYGPGDHSMVGVLLRLYAKRILVLCPFQDTGLSWVHVDDVAAGMVRAYERGAPGESYVLGGDNETIGGVFRRIAPRTGIRAPGSLPDGVVRAAVPFSPLVARALGQQPWLLKEGLASLNGSWMFSSGKAERDLGYGYRRVEDGVVETVRALRAE
jgi:dihydroflavonol-4-reductase